MSETTTFGDFIRSERDRARLGLREAARLLEISPSYLSRVEAGEAPAPSPDVLRKMASQYRTDWFELLKRAKDRAGQAMAADVGTAPLLHVFYRAAKDQTPEVQEQMLCAALDAIQLPPAQRAELLNQLRQLLSRPSGDLPRRANGRDHLFAMDIAPRRLSRAHLEQLAADVLTRVFGGDIPIPVPLDQVVSRFDENIVMIGRDIERTRLADGSPSVLGLSRWSADGKRRELVLHEELLDAIDAPVRRRANFTIAHELFHCIEHLPLVQSRCSDVTMARSTMFVSAAPELTSSRWYERAVRHRSLFSNEDWREWQANQFAAELLMPEAAVRSAFHRRFGDQPVDCPPDETRAFADEIARLPCPADLRSGESLADLFDVNPQPMAIRLMSLGLVSSPDAS